MEWEGTLFRRVRTRAGTGSKAAFAHHTQKPFPGRAVRHRASQIYDSDTTGVDPRSPTGLTGALLFLNKFTWKLQEDIAETVTVAVGTTSNSLA